MPPQAQGKQDFLPIYGAQRSRTDKNLCDALHNELQCCKSMPKSASGSRGDVCGLEEKLPEKGRARLAEARQTQGEPLLI